MFLFAVAELSHSRFRANRVGLGCPSRDLGWFVLRIRGRRVGRKEEDREGEEKVCSNLSFLLCDCLPPRIRAP